MITPVIEEYGPAAAQGLPAVMQGKKQISTGEGEGHGNR